MRTMTALFLAGSLAWAGDPRADAVRKLDAKVSLDLKASPLAQAVAILQEATGLTFVIAEGAETPVTLTVRDVSAKAALRLMLSPNGLGAAFESGTIVIRSRQAIAGPVILKVYDLRSAALKPRDIPGPRVELQPLRVSFVA